MSAQLQPVARAEPARPRVAAERRRAVVASYLAVGLAALLPRALDLGGFVTVDEAAYWIGRSETFLAALRSGDYAATAISAHPGVTTMWLGAAGLLLRRLLLDLGLLGGVTYADALALLRLPAVLVHVAVLLASFALLRRLLPPAAALLAALLWAADPFQIAYARVLHVDALSASFAALSLLAASQPRRTPATLALAAAAFALALLSKSPALLLAPAVALALVWPPPAPAAPDHPRPLARLALWGALVALTAVALWPALWADPAAVYDRLRFGVEVEGGTPHMLGNYFLGQPDAAPGAAFYPVALALRTTPLTLAGLLLLGLPPVWRRCTPAERRTLALLALGALLVVAGLSLFPKKFNRYLLPAFPLLAVLAAVGLLGALAALRAAVRRRWPRALAHPAPAAGLLGALALLNALSWHPYAIAAYNQALGGAPTGAWAFLTGWGEGHEQVAAWLAARPDITGVETIAAVPNVLQPYMPRGAAVRRPNGGQLPPDAGYLVVDIRQVQDGELPAPFGAYHGVLPPLHTVTIHGVPYAWVYQVAPATSHPQAARFGDGLALVGAHLAAAPARGQPLALSLVWQPRAASPAGLLLFAHLLDAGGARLAQADLPLAAEGWQPGSVVRSALPLALPADLPPGPYRLVVGVYDGATGARLPLHDAPPVDPALAGPDAHELLSFRLE